MEKTQKIETKLVAKYNGHSVKTNQSVDLGFKVSYDQLTSSVQVLQYLNVDVTILAKLPGEKPMNLGVFRVNKVNIDHDGETKMTFNSMNDFVNADNFNKLVGSDLVNLKLSAVIELEEEGEE